jgi:hypothetical protein
MDSRRSTRVSVVLPVLLSGSDANGFAFKEKTQTIDVNKNGAKLTTSFQLGLGKQVRLSNSITEHFTAARVIHISEKGSTFEVGIELFEPHDLWGLKGSDWHSLHASMEQQAESKSAGNSSARHDEARSIASPAEDVTSEADPGPLPPSKLEPFQISSQKKLRALGGGGRRVHPAPQAQTILSSDAKESDKLQSSRADLANLLATAQDIQQASWQVVRSLFDELHSRLHRELEAASVGFVEDTSKRLKLEASNILAAFDQDARAHQAAITNDAAAQLQTFCTKTEASLAESLEEFRRKLSELSTCALDNFQHHEEALVSNCEARVQKIFEDLRKESVNGASEELRATSGELSGELRRRAEVGFEILQGELVKAGKIIAEEAQKQISHVSDAALSSFNREVAEGSEKQIKLGSDAVLDVADRTKSALDAYFQQSLAEFHKRVEKLAITVLEENRRTSDVILVDLQNRLVDAARALHHANKEPPKPADE